MRKQAIYGNHILLTKLLSRRKKLNKSSTGSIEESIILYEHNTNNQHTSQCTTHEPMYHYHCDINVPSTYTLHTLSFIHFYTNRMFWLSFLISWGTQFVILYGNYTSHCYLYIFIYTKPYNIFLYDLNRGKRLLRFSQHIRWNHCHGS